jgi:hypothetical protein
MFISHDIVLNYELWQSFWILSHDRWQCMV